MPPTPPEMLKASVGRVRSSFFFTYTKFRPSTTHPPHYSTMASPPDEVITAYDKSSFIKNFSQTLPGEDNKVRTRNHSVAHSARR